MISFLQLDFLLNGQIVEELAVIVHSSKATSYGKSICEKLQEKIPRQQFHVSTDYCFFF